MKNQFFASYETKSKVSVVFTADELTYSMKAHEQLIMTNSLAAGTTCILYLPPVTETEGRVYSICDVSGAATYNVTIADLDDSTDWTDDTLTAAADSLLLYSDGRKWHKICDMTT